MTEEVIIDGVNVTECEFAVKPKNDNRIKCHCAKGLLQIAKMQEQPESIKSGLCENNPYCYYKQFKHLEQKYNEVLKLAKENADSNEYCLQELEKENENLKSLLDFEAQKAETYQQENEELKEKLGNTEVLLANAESDLKFEEERTNKLEKENEELKEKNIELQIVLNEIDRPNNYRHTLEKIREICKCSKEMNCKECPECDNCEELCANDENLQDILIDKINEVLK